MVPHQEIQQLDDAFLSTLATGDTVPVYVTRTPVGSEQLLVSLERGLQEMDWERAVKLQEDEATVELKIVNYNKGGLVVEFGRIQGFVPNSHVPAIQNVYSHDKRTSYKSKQVGETLKLKIIEVDPPQERFVLSAKSAQRAASGAAEPSQPGRNAHRHHCEYETLWRVCGYWRRPGGAAAYLAHGVGAY